MSNTKTLVIVSFLLSLVLLGLFIFGVFYIRRESQATAALLSTVSKGEGRDTVAQSIRTIQNSSMNEVEALQALVLTDEKLVGFIELIEDLGQGMGLEITITSVSVDKADETKNSTKPTKVHVMIETDGSWSASNGFIYALENLPSHDTIDSVTLSKGTEKWHTSSSITLYSFKQ